MSKMPIPSDRCRPFSWAPRLRAPCSVTRAGGRAASLALALPLLVALSSVLGCGGASKGASDASGASAEKGATPWKDKTRPQRLDWMGLEVFPKMKGVFKEFDANRFSEFACQTCHSEQMEMVDFKMPNKTIYSLPRTNTVQSAREYDEQVTDFMVNTVTPKMAELLDMPVYNPETKSGFGCFGCHPQEGG